MKPLIQSTVWCPDHQGRIKDVMLHLNALQTYNGEFDVLLVDNGSCSEILDKLKELEKLPNFIIEYNENNIGWAKARNRGIKKCLEDNYPFIALMDCDIVVEDLNWLLKVENALKVFPAFMCRHSKQPGWIAKIAQGGVIFDLWDEWLGCINIMTPPALKVVGGYDWETFPQHWGFHDCEMGRRLLKAGFFGSLTNYPSLSGLGVVEYHARSYDDDYQPGKNEQAAKYAGKFWETHAKIMAGEKPLFFDFREE